MSSTEESRFWILSKNTLILGVYTKMFTCNQVKKHTLFFSYIHCCSTSVRMLCIGACLFKAPTSHKACSDWSALVGLSRNCTLCFHINSSCIIAGTSVLGAWASVYQLCACLCGLNILIHSQYLRGTSTTVNCFNCRFLCWLKALESSTSPVIAPSMIIWFNIVVAD